MGTLSSIEHIRKLIAFYRDNLCTYDPPMESGELLAILSPQQLTTLITHVEAIDHILRNVGSPMEETID